MVMHKGVRKTGQGRNYHLPKREQRLQKYELSLGTSPSAVGAVACRPCSQLANGHNGCLDWIDGSCMSKHFDNCLIFACWPTTGVGK